mgnify:CR=1 FL=1
MREEWATRMWKKIYEQPFKFELEWGIFGGGLASSWDEWKIWGHIFYVWTEFRIGLDYMNHSLDNQHLTAS